MSKGISAQSTLNHDVYDHTISQSRMNSELGNFATIREFNDSHLDDSKMNGSPEPQQEQSHTRIQTLLQNNFSLENKGVKTTKNQNETITGDETFVDTLDKTEKEIQKNLLDESVKYD